MTPRTVCLIAAIALLSVSLPAIAWDMDCKFGAERSGSIDTAGATRVEILARAGGLTVKPATGATLTAGGRACVSSRAFLDETQLHVRRDGEVVRVQVQLQVPEKMQGFGVFDASLDSSGDISIDRVAGDVTIDRDSSGDVTVPNVGDNFELKADGSGQVRVTSVNGEVRVP